MSEGLKVLPLIEGGIQEKGLRAGTHNLAGIAGTSGSTCSSEALKVSHVLGAIGVDPVWAQGSVVFTLGTDNTFEDVELFLKELPPAVDKLRQMSPLTSSSNTDQFRHRQ